MKRQMIQDILYRLHNISSANVNECCDNKTPIIGNMIKPQTDINVQQSEKFGPQTQPETTSSQQQIIITHKCKKRKQYLIILDEAFIRSTDELHFIFIFEHLIE
ncbi:hypothetical protein DERP_001856 [Dermatophagoides pteronyssinus]|uniref:Uncharacterized protein n=1 Tax=Dermatophagoides pteronyssinus TaxID=6956 RepID=A0ABQ8JBN5_DERPT|nr:hypothetical protein DERP_001856 [Dermatophagoides pteronyssinus]